MLFFRILVMCICLSTISTMTYAETPRLEEVLQKLAISSLKNRERSIDRLLHISDPRLGNILQDLSDGKIYQRKTDKVIVTVERDAKLYRLRETLTGRELGTDIKKNLRKIKINNKLRRKIKQSLSLLELSHESRRIRLAAAQALLQHGTKDDLSIISHRLQQEKDPEILLALQRAKASRLISAQVGETAKAEAIDVLAEMGGLQALVILQKASATMPSHLEGRLEKAIQSIEFQLQIASMIENIWYGISLGSVLLLAAVGLAITFGVMGVINMAHGEMVMVGAYTTFVVQQFFGASSDEYSLVIALPAAFLAAGFIGLCLERGIIRHLYGRPLETLLATWGVSLILQQAIRTIFGATNKEVRNPDWMSGAVQIGDLAMTWNRLWILCFAISVFCILFLVLKKSRVGLYMRAVTQNRSMAASMGIRTPWVDSFTFFLGSGIAGIAGVALSQIGNVSPNLGQGYIIDSFMVVVFGGVGNLWGTLVGAFTLGIANKFLEPVTGAVLGKILVLVFIILFIQKRPSGLFALKGRAAEK